MSAKDFFQEKLQDQRPRNVAFNNKAEADIATYRQRIYPFAHLFRGTVLIWCGKYLLLVVQIN